MENRNVQLDIIRFVALFLIILCHTQIGLDSTAPILVKLKWFVGKCGVPLFFMVSGYLNLPVKYADGEFILRRLKRVFIPFLFWSIVYRILAILLLGKEASFSSEDVFLIASSAHLWYIYAILAVYLITPILSEYFQKCSRHMFNLYLLVWMISTTFTYYYHSTGHCFFDHNITYIAYYLTGYLGYYLLGYYIKRFSPNLILERLNLKNSLILGGILICAIGLIYVGYFYLNMSTVEISSYVTSVPMLLSIFLFSLLWKIKVANPHVLRIVTTLSKYSFGIYLIHEIVIYYILQGFFNDTWYLGLNGTLMLLINIVVVCVNIMISFTIVRLLSLVPKSKFILG